MGNVDCKFENIGVSLRGPFPPHNDTIHFDFNSYHERLQRLQQNVLDLTEFVDIEISGEVLNFAILLKIFP